MKNLLKYILFLIVPVIVASCADNENWTIVTDVMEGTYITGTATIYSGEAPASALKVVPLDGSEEQSDIVGIYTWLKADGDFMISIADEPNVVVKFGQGDEVTNTDVLKTYALVQDASPFKVASDGMYYIVVNTTLMQVNILPVTYGIIGAATPEGWNAETPFDAATFDGKLTVSWTGKLNMSPGGYKFRYSGGWGQQISLNSTDNVKLFTDLGNFGAAAPLIENSLSQVRPGGPDFSTEFGGEFQFTIQYDIRSRAFNATYVMLGPPIIPPTYPAKMYLVGDGTFYGWDSPGSKASAEMHKVAGGGNNEGLYWKILYLEGGKGFKVSAANWGNPNLGHGEVTSFDPNGVEVSNSGGNMSIATSGIYTIVLDLRNDETKLSVSPTKVYGMGNTFGGWDKDKAANLFTTSTSNSKLLVSPALSVSDNIRMYVSHPWIPDWWQAEFNVYSGIIEYRNDGGDQAGVAGTAGQVITLNFDENTGTIQ